MTSMSLSDLYLLTLPYPIHDMCNVRLILLLEFVLRESFANSKIIVFESVLGQLTEGSNLSFVARPHKLIAERRIATECHACPREIVMFRPKLSRTFCRTLFNNILTLISRY